jgi:Glutaredoxin-like domain (DUF836)
MAAITLLLYSRPGCHLCDEMEHTVQSVTPEFECRVEHVDISSDPVLEARFGEEIPLLFVNGRKAFKYRVTTAELRKRLRNESRSRSMQSVS